MIRPPAGSAQCRAPEQGTVPLGGRRQQHGCAVPFGPPHLEVAWARRLGSELDDLGRRKDSELTGVHNSC